jgi:hypothetical protein
MEWHDRHKGRLMTALATRLTALPPPDGQDGERRIRDDGARLAVLVGGAAVVFSGLYLLSDLIELAQGGFSILQLALTYAAEAAVPIFVLGLFAVQRPRIGLLGFVGAVLYAYVFVFFTGTVMYALIDHTDDWDALTSRLGAWMTVHSVLMVVAGVMFAMAVIRAGVLPRWTGITLITGMVLMTASSALPAPAQTMSAAVRDVAVAGMGVALLRRSRRPATGAGSDMRPSSHARIVNA